MKKTIKNNKYFRLLRLFFITLKNKPRAIEKIKLFNQFIRDYKNYKKNGSNRSFTLSLNKLKPCLFDKIESTPLDYIYFYQDTWCAKKIFENKPSHHYDFGSKAEFVGIISQFAPTTMIDIRPIDVKLNNLNFIKGDITDLPFADDSLESVSSICVIEHIGLGRYGDKLDAFGSEKAIDELKRVLAPSGSLYVSLPIDKENLIYFNAHRAFTRDYIIKLFSPLKLMEEKYIYKKEMADTYDKSRGFGTGMFHFKKL